MFNLGTAPRARKRCHQATVATAALTELGVIRPRTEKRHPPPIRLLAFDKVASVHGALFAQGIATMECQRHPPGVYS